MVLAYIIGYLGASASARANKGLSVEIEAKDDLNLPQASFWMSQRLSNLMWAQLGMTQHKDLSLNGDGKPHVFLMIFAGMQSVWSTGDDLVPLAPGMHKFEIYLATGTTWAFAVDGILRWTYDMKSDTVNAAYPLEAVMELPFLSGTASSVYFPTRKFANFSELINGQWLLVPIANGYDTSYGSFELLPMKVKGNLQDASLPQGTFVVGQDVPTSPFPSPILWYGASAPAPATIPPAPTPVPPTATFQATFTEAGLPLGLSYQVTVDGLKYVVQVGTSLILQLSTQGTHMYSYQSKVTTGGPRWKRKSYCTSMSGIVSAASTTAMYSPC